MVQQWCKCVRCFSTQIAESYICMGSTVSYHSHRYRPTPGFSLSWGLIPSSLPGCHCCWLCWQRHSGEVLGGPPSPSSHGRNSGKGEKKSLLLSAKGKPTESWYVLQFDPGTKTRPGRGGHAITMLHKPPTEKVAFHPTVHHRLVLHGDQVFQSFRRQCW